MYSLFAGKGSKVGCIYQRKSLFALGKSCLIAEAYDTRASRYHTNIEGEYQSVLAHAMAQHSAALQHSRRTKAYITSGSG